MSDILDTRFKDKELELEDNSAALGDDVNLTAKDPTLKRIIVAAGWDVNTFDSKTLDLDLSAVLIDKNNMTIEDQDFIYYNNREAYDGAVNHNGDSRTGAGEGDDETITIDLNGVSFNTAKILFVLSIYKGDENDQNLGMVRGGYIRVLNAENKYEMLRYTFNDDLERHKETAMLIGSLNREGPKWHFTPLSEFVEGGLGKLAEKYGMVIGQQ